MGTKFTYRQFVTEPELGRVLVEVGPGAGVTTTFTLEPLENRQQIRVTIVTDVTGLPKTIIDLFQNTLFKDQAVFSFLSYGILSDMDMPLLQTKLYMPPPRPELVPRPRLIERLNEGLRRNLTLVSAPAGFGKTTLVSEWLDKLQLDAAKESQIVNRVAWLSLDEADNDPTRFLTYLTAALRQADPDIGQTAQAMLQAGTGQPPHPESIMTLLINNLAAASTDVILVLDDYHVLKAQPIHHALAFLLDHLPPPLHLIITSRTEPPLPLPRLRARGHLLELGIDALRFSLAEAEDFLSRVMGLTLSAQEVAALHARTEGWATDLQLAALAIQAPVNRSTAKTATNFLVDFSGKDRYVSEYLLDEVFQRQDEKIQTFLLQTSILAQLTGALCDHITGQSDGREMLTRLDKTGLFIVPLDNEGCWYRYHPLFADALRSRLPQTMDAQELVALHRRAGAWYERNATAPDTYEFIPEAVSYSLVGEDFERTARLIAQIAPTAIWQRGEINTVLSWLDRLPHQAEQAWPQLALTHALLLAWRQQFDAAESLLEGIIESTQTLSTVEHNKFLGQTATIRATMANMQGDVRRAMAFAREALEQLPEDDLQSRGISPGILGGIHRARGELRAGIQAYTDASPRRQAAGERVPALIALGYLGQLRMLNGQLNQAYVTYQQALQLAETWGAQKFPVAGVVRINLGDLLRERDELEAADHHLQEGIELCGRWAGLGEDIFEGYLSLARVHQAQGNLNSAQALIQRAREMGQNHNVPAWPVFVGDCQARL